MLTAQIKAYFPYLFLAALVIILFILPQPVQQYLEYNRGAIADGQLWRLLSGHLLHSNSYHLVMNMAGLIVMMLIHGALPRRLALWWQYLIFSIAISIGLWFLSPDIQLYVGLSGVLHGLLCFGAVLDIRQGYRSGYLILVGVAAKIIAEQYFGPDADLSAKIAAEVAIDAHLYGAIAGIITGAICFTQAPRQ